MGRWALVGRSLLLGGGFLGLVSLTALTYTLTGPDGGVIYHLPTLVPGALLFLTGGTILLLRAAVTGREGREGGDAVSPQGQTP